MNINKISSKILTQEQIDKINKDEFIRAGGDCICKICGLLYKQHLELVITEHFFLTELCDKTLVKL